MLRLRFGKFFASLLCAFCLLISFTSQASAALTPLNDNTEFVKQVYQDFLNRQPDTDGLNYWVGQLEAGAFDRSELVEQYLLSPEFGETVSPVVRLYFTYYQRIPDYAGLMFWVNSYAAGVTLNDVSNAFADAQEFIDKYGSLTNEEFVSKMYINVYDRQPDSGGLAYWTDLLDTKSLTRGQVMIEFSSAEEYLSISANQVYATMTYMGLLRRAPEQEGFDYWVGIMDGGASGLALIDSFLISDEYAVRDFGGIPIDGLVTGVSSLNGTYNFGRMVAGFPSGGDNLMVLGGRGTLVFDGNGGCTVSLNDTEYDLDHTTGIIADYSSTEPLLPCTYTVEANGELALNITGDAESSYGAISATGDEFTIAGIDQSVTSKKVTLLVGVK